MGIPVIGGGLEQAKSLNIVGNKVAGILERARKFDRKDLGIGPDAVETEKASFVTVLLDDTGSMEDWVEMIIRSYNAALNVICEAQSLNAILVGAMGLSGEIIFPYQLREDAQKLSRESYRAHFGRTPLHRRSVDLCALVTAKQGEFAAEGIPTRTLSLLMTDGGDSDYDEYLGEAQTSIKQLLGGYKSKVYGVGFGSHAICALSKMGVPNETLFPAGNEKELAKAFQEFSQATSAAF